MFVTLLNHTGFGCGKELSALKWDFACVFSTSVHSGGGGVEWLGMTLDFFRSSLVQTGLEQALQYVGS